METKIKRYAILLMITMIPCVFLCSCSSEPDNPLVGTWKCNNVTHVFNADGSGYTYFDLLPTSSSYTITFTWSANGNQIIFHTISCSSPGIIIVNKTQVKYYTILDGALTLYYSDFELDGVYLRQ